MLDGEVSSPRGSGSPVDDCYKALRFAPNTSFSSACKALVYYAEFTYGLKPVPFTVSSFSAVCKAGEQEAGK